MNTAIFEVSSSSPDSHVIEKAASVLRGGGLVAFPTETVYGLGADAQNEKAIKRVFEAKGRPADNPLIVHIDSLLQAGLFARDIPENGKKLADIFWPGPLTLVLPKLKHVPGIISGNLDTVALRMPNHPVALALLKKFGGGVVAPSANISGRPSPTEASHVVKDLGGRIELILDGGRTEIGIESTVIDVTADPPVILRQGGLSRERIEQAIGKVGTTTQEELLKRSPGTRHKHYAPKATVIIIGVRDETAFAREASRLDSSGKMVGAITHSFGASYVKSEFRRKLAGDPALFAREMFGALRELDEKNVDVILVESVEEKGIGSAIMDRLRKAAQT